MGSIIIEDTGYNVTRETNWGILPNRKLRSVSITGKDGAIVLGSKLNKRTMTLDIILGGNNEEEYLEARDRLAELFGDLETKKLRFSHQNRSYYVRYTGGSNSIEWVKDGKITIPLLLADPYAYGEVVTVQDSDTSLNNQGTEATPLLIEIAGPANSPTITVGEVVLRYNGIVEEGEILKIDGGTKEVTIAGENVLYNLEGIPPLLTPGQTEVQCSSGVCTWTWEERYLI